MSKEAVAIGIMCAITMPLLALIAPISKTVNSELRDSLNTFRRKADNMKVQFHKLESEYNLSIP